MRQGVKKNNAGVYKSFFQWLMAHITEILEEHPLKPPGIIIASEGSVPSSMANTAMAWLKHPAAQRMQWRAVWGARCARHPVAVGPCPGHDPYTHHTLFERHALISISRKYFETVRNQNSGCGILPPIRPTQKNTVLACEEGTWGFEMKCFQQFDLANPSPPGGGAVVSPCLFKEEIHIGIK